MNIYQKLVEVRKEVHYLSKENPGYQFKYVSSSQVLASLRAKMDELNLILLPSVIGHKVTPETIEWTEKDKPKKQTTYFTELNMVFVWINADNPEEKLECTWYGQGLDTAGEKGVGKALTYAEKYFLLKFFNIATDKDDPDSFQDKHTKPDKPEEPKTESKPKPGITEKQIARLWAIANKASASETSILSGVKRRFGKDKLEELTKEEYDTICNALEGK